MQDADEAGKKSITRSSSSLTGQFDNWFQSLFADDDTRNAAADSRNRGQDAKARRLSLGGTAESIFLGGKIANRKVLRRQQSLPSVRRGFILGNNRDILEDNEEREATEVQAAASRERQAAHSYRKIQWKSERKLSIASESAKAARDSILPFAEYSPDLFVRLHAAVAVPEADLIAALPGVGIAPLLIGIASRASEALRSSTVPCAILGLGTPGHEQSQTEAVVLRSGGTSQSRVEAMPLGYDGAALSSLVDQLMSEEDEHGRGLPVLVAKRTHFLLGQGRGSTPAKVREPVSSLVFLYTRDQVMHEISRNVAGPLMLQRFVRARGGRPWCVRVKWSATCNDIQRVWVLTSTSKFAFQDDPKLAKKVGQVWAPRQDSSDMADARWRNLGGIGELRGAAPGGVSIHQLATDTASSGRCNVVATKRGIWQVPEQLASDFVAAFSKHANIPLKSAVLDFVQTSDGAWKLLQLKSFVIEQISLLVDQMQLDGKQVSVVRKRSAPRNFRSVTGHASTGVVLGSEEQAVQQSKADAPDAKAQLQCCGSHCDEELECDDAETQEQHQIWHEIDNREILFDMAQQRAEEHSKQEGTSLPSNLCEDELESWLTVREVQAFELPVRVCDTCYWVYHRAAQMRARRKIVRERQAKQADAKTQQACLRLYNRFVEGDLQKNAEVVNLMLEIDEGGAKKKRKRRVRRKPRRSHSEDGEEAEPHESVRMSTAGSTQNFDSEVDLDVLALAHEAASPTPAAGFTAGDRVVDSILGPGTVVDVDEDLFATLRLDTGAVESDISCDRLCHTGQQMEAKHLQLNANELMGMSPLPPAASGTAASAAEQQKPLGMMEDLGDFPFPDLAAETGPEDDESDETNDSRAVQLDPEQSVSQSFASMFMLEGTNSTAETASESFQRTGLVLREEARRAQLNDSRAGALCPFGCGQRIKSALAAHVSSCPGKTSRNDRLVSASLETLIPSDPAAPRHTSGQGLGRRSIGATPGELGISKVNRLAARVRLPGASRRPVAPPS